MPVLLALLAGCGVAEIEAILDKYDTFGTTATSGTGTSTGSTSTGSTSSGEAEEGSTTRPGEGTTEVGSGSAGGSSEAGETSSSSGAPVPVCGDGVVDAEMEECDDGNDDPDDGCKLCARDRVVFASSVEYRGDELDGLYGADQRCRMLAALAGLPNFGTYRAWLSDSTTSAADRFVHSRGRYVLVDGTVVADDWDGLVSGSLQHAINVTEHSEVSDGNAVWTGTLANGQRALGTTFCTDWNESDQIFDFGGNGLRQVAEDGTWSYFGDGGCNSVSVLYCFEQ